MCPSPRIYLRSLQDQRPHPRARQSFIDLASYGFRAATYVRRVKIQVSGDYLALTVQKSLSVEAVLVWHWPSGAILAVRCFSSLDTPTRDESQKQALHSSLKTTYYAAFCTSDGYLLVNRQYGYGSNRFGIDVYALHMDEEIPSLLAAFDLPKLVWDSDKLPPLNTSFASGYGKHAQMAGGIAAGALTTTPAQVLVQLRLDPRYVLFTPLSTFLSASVLADRRRLTPLRHPWQLWGPKRSRMLNEAMEADVVCGYKVIYSKHIFDFCPVRNGDDDDDGSVVTAPTTIKSRMFTELVETNLPYRKVNVPDVAPLKDNQQQMFFEDVDGPKVGVGHLYCLQMRRNFRLVHRLCVRLVSSSSSYPPLWTSTP